MGDKEKTCFVIMPIGSKKETKDKYRSYEYWKGIYDNMIVPAVRGADPAIRCTRADQETAPGEIADDILFHLSNDYLCIADLTGRNPNVFYELGIRDSWHGRTITIAQDTDDLPFDKGTYRTISYHESDVPALRQFESQIRSAINDIGKQPDKPRNRVQLWLRSQQTPATPIAASSLPSFSSFSERVEKLSFFLGCKGNPSNKIAGYTLWVSKTTDGGPGLIGSMFTTSTAVLLGPITENVPDLVSIYADFAAAVEGAVATLATFPSKLVVIVPLFLRNAQRSQIESKLEQLANTHLQLARTNSSNDLSHGLRAMGPPPHQGFWRRNGTLSIEVWDISGMNDAARRHQLNVPNL